LRDTSNLSDVFGKEQILGRKLAALNKTNASNRIDVLVAYPPGKGKPRAKAGIPGENTYIVSMTKPPPSPSQVARSERMRVAAIEGAKARADVEARDVAVRKNMERLRALRLAKEAEEESLPKPVKAAGRAKKAAAKPTATLSDFLHAQKSSGRTT
jgi:hypothetical protein